MTREEFIQRYKYGYSDTIDSFAADLDALLEAERKRCADLAEFDYKHANSLTIARAIRGLK